MSNNTQKGIIAWFARNPVAANLMMAGIILGGIYTAFIIKKDFFPESDPDTISVQATFRGATPAEVEDGLLTRLEDAVENIEGIKEIVGQAREGSASLSIEVQRGYDVQTVMDEVKVQIDAINGLPSDVERPVVYERRFLRDAIEVVVFGNADEATLKELAKDVRDEIRDLPAVSRADLEGVRDYEVEISVTEETLREYSLTFDDVVQAVQRSSVDLAAGQIRTPGGDILLRTNAQAYRGEEFADIVLLTRDDGTRLLLSDIATVTDGFVEEATSFSFNGQPAVGLEIYVVGDESILAVTSQVREYVEAKQRNLPEGFSIAYWDDGSRAVQDRIDLMLRNALMSGMLVFISLTLFLRLKLAFWVMLGLPVCFTGALLMMPQFDTTINMLTLFGFILVLGIVVDDAIVIGENVYTTIRRDGHSLENVIKGAQEVAMPATFGVLTTVAAFLPMLFLEGGASAFWFAIGIVVILCLAFSLVESKLILPAHLAHSPIKRISDTDKRAGPFTRFQQFTSNGLERFVDRFYKPALETALRFRYATVTGMVSITAVTFALVAGGFIKWQYFPSIPRDAIGSDLRMAEGTAEDITRQTLFNLEASLVEVGEDFERETGQNPIANYRFTQSNATSGRARIELLSSEERADTGISTADVQRAWREKVGLIPGAVEWASRGNIGGGGAAIDVQLEGDDVQALDTAAEELKQFLTSLEGVTDITDTFQLGKQELLLEVLPSAEALGITREMLARQVRSAFFGAEAQRIQRGGEEVRVMVRYPRSQRESVGNLEAMRIRTPAGEEVPFGSVARVELGRGFSTITRIDGKRVVNVRADVDKDNYQTGPIIAAIESGFLPQMQARYPSVNYSLEGEARDQNEFLTSLARGFAIAMFGVYALLAIPLKSYFKPFIVMSVIPFGVVGAILGHGFMDLLNGAAQFPMSLLSILGFVALAGVVVNDSLVLVDFINKREARGMRHIDAVKDAGAARFRAVMLTSLTTFLGLMPLLFEKSVQAQFLIPMATSLAFGILFATIITLFLVPSLYLILDDIRRTLRAIVRLYTPQPSEVDAGAGDGTYARSREESPGGRGRETSLIV